MFQSKVACNPTNSACIDFKGNLFVWGSKRYGLVWGPQQAAGSLKTLNIPKPTKLNLDVKDMMEEGGINNDDYKILTKDGQQIEFSIHKLLDPPRKSGEQINYATHISLGAYHGGVICNDLTTNYEFTQLQGKQREILDNLKIFLLRTWDILERQNVEEITKIQWQYFNYYENFINSTQNETENKEDAKRTRTKSMKHHFSEKKSGAWGNTFASKVDSGSEQIKQGEVSVNLKIEFALRHLSRDYSVSSFPFVPIQKLKNFMEVGNINIRDIVNFKRIQQHLTKCFNQQRHALSKKKLQTLNDIQINNPEITEWFNLKELRDQLIGYRQSNGKLFMFGMKSEGRLGDGGLAQKKDGIDDSSDDGGQFDIITEKMFQVIFKKEASPDDEEKEIFKNLVEIDTRIQICKVQCGSSFTLALSMAGNLYSWGFGKSGSLGLGEISYTSTPQMIKKLHSNSDCTDMINIVSGSSHSLSLDRQGKVYSWGNGQAGRLGHGKEVGENLPRQIMALDGQFVRQIEAGEASSACITYDGFVYMWGSGQNGRLGNGQKDNENKPTFSMELKGFQVNQIIMGNNCTFAILSNNKVFGWGSSKSGKLGFELCGGKNYDLPREIISLSSYPIFQIAAGSFHTLLLTKDGNLLVMGNSKDGKLGLDFENPSMIQDIELPEIVEMTDQLNNGSKWFIQDMTILDEKKYPLFDEYLSYKSYGKLAPVCLKDIPYEVVQIAAGENFQMFLTNNGELYSCGQNKYGQIGKEEQESEDEEEENNEKSSEEEEKKEDEEIKEGEGSLFMAPELRKKFDQLKKIQEQWWPI